METESNLQNTRNKNPMKNDRWHVMDGPVQRGPMEWDDLMIELDSGMITSDTFIWTASMVEWQKIGEVLQGNLKTKVASHSRFLGASLARKSGSETPIVFRGVQSENHPWLGHLNQLKRKSRNFFKKNLNTIFKGILAAALFSVAYHYFYLAPKLLLDELAQEIPADDFSWVKKYFQNFSTSEGLISVSKNNGLTPTVYLFFPLKDQEEIEVRLIGDKDTLLRRTHYESSQVVKIKNKWAKTALFYDWNRSRLAKGVYTVIALKRSTEEVLAKRTFFLISPRDETYENALNAYHQQLNEQKAYEKEELLQVISTLEKQTQVSNKSFHAKLTGMDMSSLKEDQQWFVLQNQIKEEVDSWTPQKLAQEFYFYEEYAQLKSLERDLEEIHQKQNGFQQGMPESDKAKSAILEQETIIQSQLLNLRTQIFKKSQ